MEQDCLSSLILLSSEHDLAKELNYESVIDTVYSQEQEELTSEALANLL